MMKFLAFIACLFSCTIASAANDGIESTQETLSKYIEKTLADTGIPSISIVLIKEARIVWTKAFGYSNKKLKVPASPSTIYGTGSCIKPITSMAVLQLVDKGLIKLDDPINQHLGKHAIKDMSDQGKPVTVRHLLSHYSGLTNKTELMPVWERKLPKSLEQIAAETKSEYPPGTKYEYSNRGFALAGLLIQQVTGKSYEEYLIENILKPVGSTNTGPVEPTAEVLENRAFPYRLENRKAKPVAPRRFDIYPAGDLYISAPDMAKVLLTHLNDGKFGEIQILSPEMINEMQTPQFTGEGGLDFGIKHLDDEKFIMHGGQVPGWNTKFILATKSKTGVYVASNASDGRLSIDIIAQHALDLLRGRQVGTGLIKRVVHVGISFAEDKKSGLLKINNVFPNSSASKAGLSKGTLIHAIGGTETKGTSFSKCLRLMKGPAGTNIKFAITEPAHAKRRIVELRKQPFFAPS